jgi:hypothetical protein
MTWITIQPNRNLSFRHNGTERQNQVVKKNPGFSLNARKDEVTEYGWDGDNVHLAN